MQYTYHCGLPGIWRAMFTVVTALLTGGYETGDGTRARVLKFKVFLY